MADANHVLLLDEIDKAICRLQDHKANMILKEEDDKTMLKDVALAIVAEIIKPGAFEYE